ncbi:MAG: pilus assembly protein, partial [Gammaproteobacteria bacterium]
ASPVAYSCQVNYMVLMTDGRPNTSSETQYRGSSCDITYDYMPDGRKSSARCAAEIVDHGLSDDLASGSGFSGQQNVVTSTIAFNLDEAWAQRFMREIATAGGGTAYEATDASSLADAFADAIDQAPDGVTISYNPPAIPAEATRRFVNRDEAYFGLFKPTTTDYWTGNLKRYGTRVVNGQLTVVDAADQPALEDGLFRSSARSEWTTGTDGADITLGGAAHELGTSRNTYTYLGGGADLEANENALHETNIGITNTMLGAADGAEADELIKWIRGLDRKDIDGDSDVDEARKQMGAVLHGSPLAVEYNGKTVVYVPTTEGYLHAFDSSDGSELFAYMPQELLGNIKRLYEDQTTPSTSSIPYGLDGPMTLRHDDANDNGIVDGSEPAYLYFGMRRGGRNYYALDVSDPDSPRYLWSIAGGVTTGFEQLGQSWSKPALGKVDIEDDGVLDVLVFGGGYDITQDAVNVARRDDMTGAAIYIVDAITGERLWWASKTGSGADLEVAGMNNGIAADLSVLDMDQNGLFDRIYAADTGGRVFRIDIDDSLDITANGATSGGAIADINGGTVAGNRHFFNQPDVALIGHGASQYLSIAIGSGNRAHPSDALISDRFYVLRDTPVQGKPTSYSQLTESSLFDASAGAVTGSVNGWYFSLGNSGEKVLAEAVTFDNKVLFTTYTPGSGSSPTSSGPCVANSAGGQARFYAVDTRDASAVLNLDGMGDVTNLSLTDRSVNLVSPGIPGLPRFVNQLGTSGSLESHVLVGIESPGKFNNRMFATLWLEVE